MNLEEELKQYGIEIIKELDKDTVKAISEFVATGICNTFSNMHFNYNDLFDEICKLPMYFANMPVGLAEASYFYKNSSIYFRDGLELDDLKRFAVHEVIHHIQEVKDSNNKLIRLGICTFGKSKISNLALNEACVQIISSYILNEPLDSVKYYDIELSTISPNYYPLICNLISQICYLVGENILYNSTFYSNDNFKNRLIYLTSKKTFNKISNNFDNLLKFEEQIAIISNKLANYDYSNRKSKKYINLINKYKKKIKDTFLQTQDLLFTSYFNNQFKILSSEIDIKNFKNNLLIYQNLIGTSSNYTSFMDYYNEIIRKIDIEYDSIIKKSLVESKSNKLTEFFKNIFKIKIV